MAERLSQAVSSVSCLLPSGEEVTLSGADLGYGYRCSVFMENGGVITGGVFALSQGDRKSIALQMEEYYTRRKEKQPLNHPSAGSVFKRAGRAFCRCPH